MLEEGLFQNRCITVFGSNEPAEQMIAFLKKANIQVEFLLDNNKKKIGSFFEGIPIKKPEEALGKFRQDILILIISKHYISSCVIDTTSLYPNAITVFLLPSPTTAKTG